MEVLNIVVASVDVVESGHLNEPDNIVRVHVMGYGPLGQFVPFVRFAAINGQPQLKVLVLGLVQVGEDLLDDPGKVSSTNIVVCLHEHFPQSRLSDRVVLGVELVKPVECVPVRVDVQHVNCQVIGGQVHRFKHILNIKNMEE